MQRTSGRIDILATAMTPIHHGAGSSGNTQMQRVQEAVDPETGDPVRAPFVSGNSLKHNIREHGARFAVDALRIEDGSLNKAVTDLLFSGGALTKIGSNINLTKARRLQEIFPVLSLCGYSAGNSMTCSKVIVDALHLICKENHWRMPEDAKTLPVSEKPAGYLRDIEFGTRHETSRRPHVARLLTGGENQRMEELTLAEEKGDSAQMIYDFEIVKPGSRWWGSFHLVELTDLEVAAFKSALSAWCEGMNGKGEYLFRVGAKSSVGYGLMAMSFSGTIRSPVRAPEMSDGKELARIRQEPSSYETYVSHLEEHRDEILETLKEAVA